MDLVENIVTAMNEELPIVTINSFGTVSNVKGYHVYQGIWVPKIEIEITGKTVNLGDGEGMQVPWKLTGRSKFGNTFKNSFKTKNKLYLTDYIFLPGFP